MHLLLLGGNQKVIFNVDTPVGPGCPNKIEDVLLVQFLLTERNSLVRWAEEDIKLRLEHVTTSGVFDDATHDGILAAQELFRDHGDYAARVDGIVSVARGVYYSTAAHWTIVSLNGCVRDGDIGGCWPCLGYFDDCPPLLSARAKQLL